MNKKRIRAKVLKDPFLREIFFIVGKRKVNLKKIDNKIKKLSEEGINKKIRVNNLIVSLTSYGNRMSELKYTLFSLLDQTLLPELIQVNISAEDKNVLSDELKQFEKFGIEFFVCENLRSYTKLIPTLLRFPDKIVVTCDDDIYYEKKWLETIWECHKKDPDNVICHRVYNVTDDGNKVLPYNQWIHNAKNEGLSNRNFLMGVGGVLYPPKCLYKDVSNTELFQQLSPAADDIWFYFMTILNGVEIRHCENAHLNLRFVNPYREYGIIEGATLGQENVALGKNDIQFNAIMEYYKVDVKDYIKYLNSNKRFTEMVSIN